MQFALLFSKICLAYFVDLFLLIFLHGLACVPFLILPMYPYTRQSLVGRTPSHNFIYIVLSTMLCSVLHCGVFFSCFIIFCILYLSCLNIFVVLYLDYNTWTCDIITLFLFSELRFPL